ncbi:MAG: peptidyl-tRNA hydrolase Pth2 [Nanoarchaeota archaeon]
MKSYKQVIVVRMDLRLSKGKMAAQVSHASVEAMLKSHKDDIKTWRDQGMKKIVLRVKDLKELLTIKQKAEDSNLITALITDAGYTEIMPGTVTCLGIGPDIEERIDTITKVLKMV